MRLLRRLDYDGIRLYRSTTAIMRSHGGVLSGVTSLAQRRRSPRRFQNLYHVARVTSIWYTPKCNPMYVCMYGAHTSLVPEAYSVPQDSKMWCSVLLHAPQNTDGVCLQLADMAANPGRELPNRAALYLDSGVSIEPWRLG